MLVPILLFATEASRLRSRCCGCNDRVHICVKQYAAISLHVVPLACGSQHLLLRPLQDIQSIHSSTPRSGEVMYHCSALCIFLGERC